MARKVAGSVAESLAVLVPPERVWAALTSPRDLGLLLLGRVEMSAQPGGRFRWQWGVWEKIAPGGRPGRYTWQGTVLDVVPGSTLVLGPEAVVCLTVKGQGGATLVTVVQSVPAGQKAEDYEHGWADFLLRLKTYLEMEKAERDVRVRALVRATPLQIYRTLLDPKALRKLLPGKATVRAKVGGRFTWQHQRSKHAHTGVFLELVKNRRVAFTWEATQPASEVSIEAQPAPYGTLVAVHHTGLVGFNRGQVFGQQMFWMRLAERLRCYFYFKGRIKPID